MDLTAWAVDMWKHVGGSNDQNEQEQMVCALLVIAESLNRGLMNLNGSEVARDFMEELKRFNDNFENLANRFYSPNVSDSNFEPANLVDTTNNIAKALHKIANSLDERRGEGNFKQEWEENEL